MASLGEEILELAQETRKDVATLRRLAEILAAPDEPTGPSCLQAMLDTQERLVSGVTELQKSIAALHKAILEPRIAEALRRALSEG